jgi:hypothetical protein
LKQQGFQGTDIVGDARAAPDHYEKTTKPAKKNATNG